MEEATKRPRRFGAQWSTVAAVSFMLLSVSFVYDLPSSLSTPLQEHLHLTTSQYGSLVSSLYTVYSAPNITLPFLSGFVTQRYGERWILLQSLGVIVCGQIIFALGVQAKNTLMLIFGRFIMGFGGEVLGVLGNAIVTRRFRNDRLALALSVVLSMTRFGGVIDSIITPRVTHVYGVVQATWMMTTLTLVVASSCAIFILKTKLMIKPTQRGHSITNYKTLVTNLPPLFWQLVVGCIAIYGCMGPFNNSGLRFLASLYYNEDQLKAGVALSITKFLSVALVLPFGFLLESLRDCRALLLTAATLICVVHFAFLSHIGNPYVLLVALGTGYALYGVAFWPGVASSIMSQGSSLSERNSIPNRRVQDDHVAMAGNTAHSFELIATNEGSDEDDGGEQDEDQKLAEPVALTIGYGLMISFINLSMALVPIVLAVMEILAGYSGLEIVFVTISTIGVISVFALPKV